jgi:hypothetical protein
VASSAISPAFTLSMGLDDAFRHEITEPVPECPVGHIEDCPNLS